jgi:hypothetical protein
MFLEEMKIIIKNQSLVEDEIAFKEKLMKSQYIIDRVKNKLAQPYGASQRGARIDCDKV